MSFTITQNLFVGDFTTFTVVRCNDDAVTMRHLQPLLHSTLVDRVLGISATYRTSRQLSSIAFSTLSQVLVVNISGSSHSIPRDARRRIARTKSLIQDYLLLNSEFPKYAFMMDQIAVALYLDFSVRINDAVDMLSVSTTDGRQSLEALMNAMGGETHLEKKNVRSLFFDVSRPLTEDATSKVARKAWATCRAATLPHMSSRFASIPRINTQVVPKARLVALTSISRNADRLEALKPVFIKNDVDTEFTLNEGAINLTCARFPTRIRRSKHQVIQIEIEGKGTRNKVTGRTRRVTGRSAHISVDGPVKGDKIITVTTVGKDDPTCAESSRQDVILTTLQDRSKILSNPFFQALWLPKEQPLWPVLKVQRGVIPVHFPCDPNPSRRDLNPSQRRAVQIILSDEDSDRIVMVQGPPGTGKTTVIAASVISHDHVNSSQNIWIAAQSNVAVKNIAEKLIKEGFLKFKLLVSKDFHFGWHEHLYEDLESCVIRSDRFAKISIVEARRLLLDCKVVLCTLSMLSNPHIGEFLRIRPVETIILDEASQIECGDYLPIFHHFHSTLSKLVFIGDDKQLPPYGQEDIKELRSVFEISHLRQRASFLDTQYRMPHVIGTFISRNVYNGRLQTCHSITTSEACSFINVNTGREVKMGHSWINREEARVVVKLARLYESNSFRIITPYDAQRSLIERSLKSAKLAWEDKVFNVDSFQGNEADHIIVSVVRSRRLGFLKNERRTNVMLTRCKKSMVICSSRAFLSGEASETLVGKLAASIDKENWIDGRHVRRIDA